MVMKSSFLKRSPVVATAVVATAFLAAAAMLAPGVAEARGSSGGSGHSGGSGGGHSGGSSHSGGSFHSGSSSHSGGGRITGSHVGSWRGGGGWRGGGWRGGFRRGWGYYPYSWGWGWGFAPYSSWWWGGPNVTIVTGDDDGDGDSYGYENGDAQVGVSARTGRYAIVKTDVSPEEAQIYLDGKYIGAADDFDGRPDYLYLGPGKYHVEFRLPGYETLATDLDVTRGQRVRMDQKLKLQPRKSALDQFPPDAKGTPLGRVFTKHGPEAGAPDGDDDEAPPPPRRALRRAPARDDGFSDRGSGPAARERAPEARERIPEDRMDARPEPLPRMAGNRARMRFKVSPEDAAVYVDDKYLGAGEDLAANPRGVVTEPGTHSITVTRPGYKSKTVDVTVRVGAPVDVVVELEK